MCTPSILVCFISCLLFHFNYVFLCPIFLCNGNKVLTSFGLSLYIHVCVCVCVYKSADLVEEQSELSLGLPHPLTQTVRPLPHEKGHLLPSWQAHRDRDKYTHTYVQYKSLKSLPVQSILVPVQKLRALNRTKTERPFRSVLFIIPFFCASFKDESSTTTVSQHCTCVCT